MIARHSRMLPGDTKCRQKNTNVFWHHSEVTTAATVWNWSDNCLVPRPHYCERPTRFGSRGPRKFLRPRQTRRIETFCLTWGGAFGSGRAVNNFSALMKDVQQPWRVQRNEHFHSKSFGLSFSFISLN